METGGLQAECRLLLQAVPHLPAPAPTGLRLASDSWLCVQGKLTHPPWTTAASPHVTLAPFYKTSLQGEERMNLMGKLKNEMLLRMGSMGPSRLGLRLQERACVCLSQRKTPILHSCTPQICEQCLDPILKILGLWNYIAWAEIPAPPPSC